MFELFWDFNNLFKGGAQVEAEIVGSRPLFREVFGIRGYVMDIGCWPMVIWIIFGTK
jgi:hypothetical protein